MKHLFAPLLIAVSATPVAAQSFDISGHIDAGVTEMTRAPLFGAVDATAHLVLSSRVPLGFEFGTYLFALDSKNPHETYAAFTWNDRFKAGALRPAYDAVLPSVFDHVAPYLAYSRAEYTRSHNTVEAMRRTAVPWGLSAEGSSGQLVWALSIHDAARGDFRSASAAMQFDGQGYSLMAAFESVWSDEGQHDGVNAKLGARLTWGMADVGIAWLHPNANATPDAMAIDLQVAMDNNLGLAAFGEFTQDDNSDAYGAAISYDFGKHGMATLAATDGTAGQGLHLTYGYRF